MLQRFSGMVALSAAACATLGCSDPVPPAAATGLLIDIAQCPTTSPRTTVGNPHPDTHRTDGDPLGKPVYSGDAGVTVSCQVKETGSFFGNVKAPGISFDVSGNVNPTDGTGMGTVGLFAGGITEYVQSPDNSCSINVVNLTTGLRFQAGAIWAKFNCSNLVPSGISPPCRASGEFLLQRCDD